MTSNPTDDAMRAHSGQLQDAGRVEPGSFGLLQAGMCFLLGVPGLLLLWDQLFADPPVFAVDVAATWGTALAVLSITLGYAWRWPKRPQSDAVARQKAARVVARQESALAFVSGAISILAFILGLIFTRASESARITLLVTVTLFALCGAVMSRAVVGRAVTARRQLIIEDDILHKVDKRIAAHADAVDKRIAELSAPLASRREIGTDHLVPPARRRGLRRAALAVFRR